MPATDFASLIDALLATPAAGSDRAEYVPRLLVTANTILANDIEPYVSRRLLRIPTVPDEEAERTVGLLLNQSDRLLSRAEELLDGGEEEGAQPDEWRSDALRQARELRAFHLAAGSYLQPDAPAFVDQRGETALALSVVLECEVPEVVAAAGFWLTLLRAEHGDLDQAKALLPHALIAPSKDALPYSFFARLLRCRLVAEADGPPTALALLTQMEDRGPQWLAGKDADLARRTVIWNELLVLQDWWAALPEDSAERSWCRDRFDDLVAKHFAEPNATLARLHPAVPWVVAPPAEEKDAGVTPLSRTP